MTPLPPTLIHVQNSIPLSPFTTIGLGGKARHFVSCQTLDHVRAALHLARERHVRVHVLGGGSNVVFPDNGFDGLVIRIELKGISFKEDGDSVRVVAAAGEEWDALVQQCVSRNLGGVECLSGIPGFVGATPIQNVGAYGQEVRDTITQVNVLERQTLEPIEFSNSDCAFGYRQSRFKSADADRYIVFEVTFRLKKNGRPVIRYPELQTFIASSADPGVLSNGEFALRSVREAVLSLRRKKSMVLDPADPNSRSVGSFFMNPIVSLDELNEVGTRWESLGGHGQIPTFPSGDKFKIPAAWLVEHAGFRKGLRSGGVGVSQHHSLALVNYGGTSRELLDLAARIQTGVHEHFGIMLEREPVVVEQ